MPGRAGARHTANIRWMPVCIPARSPLTGTARPNTLVYALKCMRVTSLHSSAQRPIADMLRSATFLRRPAHTLMYAYTSTTAVRSPAQQHDHSQLLLCLALPWDKSLHWMRSMCIGTASWTM